MTSARLNTLLPAFLLLLACGLTPNLAPAQEIRTDPAIQAAIARKNWEPGGKYFNFGNVRGTLDPASRSGNIRLITLSNITVGSLSTQSAIILGEYNYVLRFSGHPSTVHGPFSSTQNSYDTYTSDPKADGSQTSYAIGWLGKQTHPADAYDGPQGGGYPPPTGARDEYSFAISGLAQGTYFLSQPAQQTKELSPLQKFWNDTSNRYKTLWNDGVWGKISVIVSPVGPAGTEFSQIGYDRLYYDRFMRINALTAKAAEANANGDNWLANWYKAEIGWQYFQRGGDTIGATTLATGSEVIGAGGAIIKGGTRLIKTAKVSIDEMRLFYKDLGAVDEIPAVAFGGTSAGSKNVASVANSARTASNDTITVTSSGVAIPPGAKYKIPENYVGNPFRPGSYGETVDGKFVEKLRIDPATPPGQKGPNYSHYHKNGKSTHYSPRPGDKDPGFTP